MILGIGTDIVVVDRVADMLARHAEHFTTRHFTADECHYCDAGKGAARAQRYAARFAAKEAAAKALGVGIGADAGWTEIAVGRAFDAQGRAIGPPTLTFHGTAKASAERLGVRKIWLSLSHEKSHAIALVVLED